MKAKRGGRERRAHEANSRHDSRDTPLSLEAVGEGDLGFEEPGKGEQGTGS